jgi:uncharacterized protein (TIGR03067 family)
MVANLFARLLEALAMKLVTTLSVLVGLLSLLSWATSAPGALADDKKDGEQNKDAALQGAWKVEIHDIRGRPASKQFLAQEHQWLFTKDGITMKDKDGVGRKGTFRIDPKKDPKSLDIALEPGLQPGPRAKAPDKEVVKCIYSLNGDTLKICYGLSGARPSAFESKAEPATGLVVLRRQPVPKEKPGKD